jgi:hypothetical protein
MKRKLSIIIVIICAIVTATVSAQDIILPNMPVKVLSSNSGFISINELTAGIGLGETIVPYSKSFIGFTTVNGYQINKNFVIAAGTGLYFYDGGLLVPLFLDFRYRFYIGVFTPYFFTDGGLLLNFSDINLTKPLINPGIGVRYSFSRKVAVNLGSGLLIQQGSSNRDAFINIKAGVTYKF